MAEEKIPVSHIFLWIGIILIILLMAWLVFGSSPTMENLSLGITTFATILTWVGLRGSAQTNKEIGNINSKLGKLEVLGEILNELKHIGGRLK